MGVPSEWRKFLFALLAGRAPACFFAALPPARAAVPFDVVVLDVMQELALVKHSDACRTGEALAERYKRALYAHLVPTDATGSTEVVAARLLVACCDNTYAVPRNKAFVEAARDGQNALIGSSAEFDAIVARAAADHAAAVRHALPPHTSAAAAAAREADARTDFGPLTHFLVDYGPFPCAGVKVWRNTCLSWQLKRLMTQAACEVQVPDGKALLIDDGFLINEARFRELAHDMVRDHGFDTPAHAPLARAALVGLLMSACVERVLLLPGRRYARLPRTGLGEADHKILYYVQRALPLGLPRRPGQPVASYLVKCQDTDVLWALLAHVPALINPATGAVDEVEVWLDTQTPADRAAGVSRPYRYVDVVACWRALHGALAAEFPTLLNPVEALLALVFSNANDFVEPFAPALKLGPATLWNVWAQSLCAAAGRPDYPAFATPGKRERVPPGFPARLAGVVNDWVAYRAAPAGVAAAPCVLALRQEAALAFFYGVVQRSPLLAGLGRRFKAASPWAQQGCPYEPQPAALMEVLTHLAGLAAADSGADGAPPLPPLFGVPTPTAMRARIARINWTLDYYVNGWKTPEYAYNWFATRGDYAQHGWQVRARGGDDDSRTGLGLCNQYLYADYIAARVAPTGEPVPAHYRLLEPVLAYEAGEPVYA